jgi:hypothetical protein
MKHVMHVMPVALLIAGMSAGCKEKAKSSPDPGPATGAATATAPAPAIDAAAPAPDAAAAPAAFLPAKLDAKQGVLFAASAGGTVEAKTADGGTKALADGTVVEITEVREAEMGDDAGAIAITSGGVAYTVGVHEVLREDALRRSADGALAVFHVITSCGDLCHSSAWVVAADGKRAALGDGVADLAVAWRPDGTELAVGSGGLWLVGLPELAVRPVEGYTAPAYAPDGTLYVRDHDGSAFTGAGGADKPKRAWKAPKRPPPDPDEGDYGADDPKPVTFGADGKPSFALE